MFLATDDGVTTIGACISFRFFKDANMFLVTKNDRSTFWTLILLDFLYLIRQRFPRTIEKAYSLVITSLFIRVRSSDVTNCWGVSNL